MNAKSWYLTKYLLLGLLFGLINVVLSQLFRAGSLGWMASSWFFLFFLPAVVLGAVISIAGRYISGLQFRHRWFGPVILIVACSIGWWAANVLMISLTPSFDSLSLIEWISAGGVGGLSLAIGLVLAWRLGRKRFTITVVTLAGALGGAVGGIFDFDLVSPDWLYMVWQGILLLGIGIAIPVNRNRIAARN